MGGRGLLRAKVFSCSRQREGSPLLTMAGASIYLTPRLPGFPAASVEPRVWNSIQEQQAWQMLFFISMETSACNRTGTPCLKCQNSLTHFSPFLQKQNSLFGSCQCTGRSQGCSYLHGYFKEKQIMVTW